MISTSRATSDTGGRLMPAWGAGIGGVDAAFVRVLVGAGVDVRCLSGVASTAPGVENGRSAAPGMEVGRPSSPGVEIGRAAAPGVEFPASATLWRHVPLVRRLEAAAPGPALGELLASIDVADVDDFTLVEIMAAWGRQEAWAQAGQNAAIAELFARDAARGGSAGRSRGLTRDPVAATSMLVGARLGVTRYQADKRVGIAVTTAEQPVLRDAWAAGVVDRDKVDALASTGTMPTAVRREVVARLVQPDDVGVSRAERCTAPRLRELVRRAEHEFDPDGAAARHERARKDRYVTVQPADDAMAYLTAYLPVDQAARAWAAIEETAEAMRAVPGETRTLGELRADALEALLDGRIALPGRGQAVTDGHEISRPGPQSSTSRRGSTRRRKTTVCVTVSAATLTGADDAPGHVDRFGPIPADVARRLAATDATWRRLVTDPTTGVLTDYSTTAYTPGVVLADGVRLRDRECTFPGCAQPAWRCELDHIDPHPGGRPARSPARGPGSARGDGTPDSSLPSGETTAGNLHPLCKHHHDAKTSGLWKVHRDPASGRTTWTAPTGHTFAVDPHVIDPTHPSRPRRHPAPGSDAGTDPPGDPGLPP